MVIRLEKRLAASAIEKLNDEFSDIVEDGAITLTAALPEERNEPDLAELPRLVLTPHRRNFGRLRTFIDAINGSEME
jgi:hypothetical protein